MMTDTERDLAGIVAARICHDLVSPMGAIDNALEMMAEFEGQDVTEERRILAESAGRAGALLRLQRLAFGRAPHGDAEMAREELGALVDGVLAAPRVEMRWTGLDGPALPRRLGRAVALMAMAARGSLGLRGRISVMLSAESSLPVSIAAEGDGASLSEAQAAWLDGARDPAPEPREVEFVLLPGALADAGARLAVRTSPGAVILNAAASP